MYNTQSIKTPPLDKVKTGSDLRAELKISEFSKKFSELPDQL